MQMFKILKIEVSKGSTLRTNGSATLYVFPAQPRRELLNFSNLADKVCDNDVMGWKMKGRSRTEIPNDLCQAPNQQEGATIHGWISVSRRMPPSIRCSTYS